MSENMTPSGPESRDRFANRHVVRRGIGVDISGISNLSDSGGVDAVDLGVCERLEFR